jgi:Uncharacterized protein conserved in bacteria
MKEITEKEAYNKMASYCSSSEHCKSEIRDKLHRWPMDDTIIEGILKRLEEENYINEERYCKNFIHNKLYFDKWGKLKIAQALYYKKIPDKMIRHYLNEINEEDYLGILNKLLENKKKNINAKNDYELKGKLIRFACGKGFSFEDIEKSIPE